MDNLRPRYKMAKQERSNKWFIRITSPWTLLEPKLKEMKEWIDIKSMITAFHKGTRTEKEHIHIALEMDKSLQKQSISERIKKIYGVKGNTQLSIKTWDGDLKVVSYMLHDKSRSLDFHKIELTEEQKAYIDNIDTIYVDIVKEAKNKASTRIVDRIIEEMAGSKWKPKAIIHRILLGVKNGQWYPPGNRMETYLQEIMIRTDPDAIDALTGYYMDRYSIQYA